MTLLSLMLSILALFVNDDGGTPPPFPPPPGE